MSSGLALARTAGNAPFVPRPAIERGILRSRIPSRRGFHGTHRHHLSRLQASLLPSVRRGRRPEDPECEARFVPEAAPKNTQQLFRNQEKEERPPARSRRRERNDEDNPRERSTTDSADDKTKKILGGVFGVLVVIGIIALKIYIRREGNPEGDRKVAANAPPPVNVKLQPQQPLIPNQNNPINLPKWEQPQRPIQNKIPNEVVIPIEKKKLPPEFGHPELRMILARWDCRLGDGSTLSYTFHSGSGRYAMMKLDPNGAHSWTGDFSFVSYDRKTRKFTIQREAPFKTTPPLFADEHEDGEVEIEFVNPRTIKIRSQKLPGGDLGWRTLTRFN